MIEISKPYGEPKAIAPATIAESGTIRVCYSSRRPPTVSYSRLHRRQVLRGLLAAGAFGATSKFVTACSAPPSPSASTQTLTMGFIYVGAKDDFGWNQSHAEGKAGVSKIVKAVEQDKVAETTDVIEVMRNMIEQDGATALFPTSFGYFDYILKLAKDYPEVQFFHCGALWKPGMPENIGNYYADVDNSQFVAGRVAAQTSNTGKLGFVAAKPITPVLRNINSFMLGAKSVKPNISLRVIFTGGWSLPIKEAEAVNSLADQGIDVVGVHVDSPKVVIETASKRGIFSSGYHVVQSSLAPKFYLTGSAYDWSIIYSNYAELIRAGKTLMNGGIPRMVRGSLKENYVKLAPFSSAVSDAVQKDAKNTIAQIKRGELIVYKGAIAANDGTVKIPAGQSFNLSDPELDKIDWLAAGIIGSTS
jgi:basic membrane protein A and related proteins